MAKVYIKNIKDLPPVHQRDMHDSQSDRLLAWMIKVHINKMKDLQPVHQIHKHNSQSDHVLA